MMLNSTEVLLTSGTKIYLEKDSVVSNEHGIRGYNTNEKKHYVIPIRSILFVRSDIDNESQ